MKAETLKPFITSPSVTEYVGNRKRNVIVTGLSIFLFIIIASLFGFTIWNSIRVTQLQKKIDSLNKFVDNMHKRLGLDYLDELNEFEHNYANNDDLIDDPDDDDDTDEDSDEDGQLLSQFHTNDYDDENKGHHSKHFNDENDDIDTGSGSYDDDDDDDDEEDDDDVYDDEDDGINGSRGGGGGGGSSSSRLSSTGINRHIDEDNGDKLFDDFEKFDVIKKRRTRSILNSNEMKSEMNKDEDFKIHDKIESDIKSKETQFKLVLDKEGKITQQSQIENLKAIKENVEESGKQKEHHDSKNLNIKLQETLLKQKHKLSSTSVKDKSAQQQQQQHNHHNHHHQDHQYHDYVLYPSQTNKMKVHNFVVDDNKQATTSSPKVFEFIYPNKNNKIKTIKIKKPKINQQNQNHRYRNGKLHSHQQDHKNFNIIAAHFNLNRLHVKENSDKDNEALLNHQRDFENSIYLPTISPWSTTYQPLTNQDHQHQNQHHHRNDKDDDVAMGMTSTTSHQTRLLPSVKNGIVTIQVPGIYYIYAQIFYQNNKDHNGYWIYHNTKPFLQCYLTIPNVEYENRNTCYTSGVIYLQKGDTIHLKDMYKDHSAILGTSKSFFGLVRLGDAEYYHYNR